jgi:hypothetical protein
MSRNSLSGGIMFTSWQWLRRRFLERRFGGRADSVRSESRHEMWQKEAVQARFGIRPRQRRFSPSRPSRPRDVIPPDREAVRDSPICHEIAARTVRQKGIAQVKLKAQGRISGLVGAKLVH